MDAVKKFFKLFIMMIMTCNKSIEANKTKYCDIERDVCHNAVHPLCPKLVPVNLQQSVNYNFLDFTQNDTDFIVSTINQFRNDLAAAGSVAGRPKGSNLRIVSWSKDYAYILKAKLLYTNVCTEISSTRQFVLELEDFVGDNNLLDTFRNRVVSGSWIGVLRAEFNEIGCVYYDDERYKVSCYINRYGPQHLKNLNSELYTYGTPCSKCVDRCNDLYKNLCDDPVHDLAQTQLEVDSSYSNAIHSRLGIVVIGLVVVLVALPGRHIISYPFRHNS